MSEKDTKEKQPESRSTREARIKDRAGFVIVIFAALLAINTMLGGSNSSQILNSTIAANNIWAWYQSKNIRGVLYETAATQTTDTKSIIRYTTAREEIEADKKDLMQQARALEATREQARQRSPWYTWAGSTLQIAIVFLTASILAVSVPMFWCSIAVGTLGAVLFSQAWLLWF